MSMNATDRRHAMGEGILVDDAHSDQEPVVDTLRVSAAAASRILERLDGPTSTSAARESRKSQRVSYRRSEGLVVRIHHPGGSVANFLVRPRNLSRTGMAFLHGGFVYPGTRCQVTLRCTEGPAIRVDGQVVRCRHVTSNAHEIGLHFETSIQLDRVMPIGRYADELPAAVSNPTLGGNAVCLDDNVDDREYMHFMLTEAGLSSARAGTVEQAIELIRGQPVDVVLAKPHVGGDQRDGDLVAVFRRAGYDGPIIAVTADDSGEASRRAMDAGFAGVLIEPFDCESLVTRLRGCMKPAGGESPRDKPLFSEQWSNAQLRPLILGFLSRLEAQVDLIRERVDADPGPELLRACLELKGTAGNLGYPSLSAAAQEMHRLCTQAGDVDAQRRQADELARLALAAVRVRDDA